MANQHHIPRRGTSSSRDLTGLQGVEHSFELSRSTQKLLGLGRLGTARQHRGLLPGVAAAVARQQHHRPMGGQVLSPTQKAHWGVPQPMGDQHCWQLGSSSGANHGQLQSAGQHNNPPLRSPRPLGQRCSRCSRQGGLGEKLLIKRCGLSRNLPERRQRTVQTNRALLARQDLQQRQQGERLTTSSGLTQPRQGRSGLHNRQRPLLLRGFNQGLHQHLHLPRHRVVQTQLHRQRQWRGEQRLQGTAQATIGRPIQFS